MAGITQCGLCGDLYDTHEEAHDCPELTGDRYVVVDRAWLERLIAAAEAIVTIPEESRGRAEGMFGPQTIWVEVRASDILNLRSELDPLP